MREISLIIALVFLFSLEMGVLAQEIELPSPGLTPESPFYFLEIIAEGIGTFFTFGDLKKAERHATLAAERLAEVQAVVEKGKPELAEKTLEKYEMQLNKSIARAKKAQAKGQSTEQVMARVGKATFIHLEVLAEVYEKVPEEAKSAIENAMKVSVKGHEKAVEVLKAQNALGEIPEAVSLPVQVPQEVRERIQMKVQEELEAEKAELQSFESFEAVEAKCLEEGRPPELCTSPEARCKEVGATTPDECYRVLSTASIKIEGHIKKPLFSEEEMEEMQKAYRQWEEKSGGE